MAVFAVENITGLLLRCRLYELYYVHREPKFSNDNLAEALTQLDVAILSFLASTERLLERDNTGIFFFFLENTRLSPCPEDFFFRFQSCTPARRVAGK